MARDSRTTVHALSIRQPWAALIVLGLKTVEVRRWATPRRGPLLIHAARLPDPRCEVWENLPPEAQPVARQYGGIIGIADLVDCLVYESPEEFAWDRPRHWNPPEWFKPPRLFGFQFANPSQLPFQPALGWMRIFRIDLEKKKMRGSRSKS